MKKILISGYIGFGNFGDEALVHVLIKSLVQIGVKVSDITVISNDIAHTTKNHGVTSVNRKNFFETVNELLKSNQLIFIGGLFQDKTSFKSFLYYSCQLFLAIFFSKEVIFYGAGVGPLQRKISVIIFNFLIKPVKLLILRDNASREFINQNQNILVTCDPVWGIETDYSFKNVIPQLKWDLPVLGISLRSDKNLLDYHIKTLVEKLSRIINTMKDWQIVFIPCMNDEDLPVLFEIYDSLLQKISEPNRVVLLQNFLNFSIQQQAGILSSCDVLIGMRYHALLLALLGGHPVLGIICDQKIKSLMEFSKQVSVSIKDDFEHPWNYFWQNLEYSAQKAKLARGKALELNKKNIQVLMNSIFR